MAMQRNFLYHHVNFYSPIQKPISLLLVILFFFMLFDGILSYILPIVITESKINNAFMGIIIGSSSIVGALFDLLLIRKLTNTHYRRLYLAMFATAFLYVFILFQAHTAFLFIAAMALWGMYYDLFNFGNYDYVSRETDFSDHAVSFGLIDIIRSIAYVVAPIIAGSFIATNATPLVFSVASLFLIFSLISFIVFIPKKTYKNAASIQRSKRTLIEEIRVVFRIGRTLSPVGILFLMANIGESFFTTLGPLIAIDLTSQHSLGSLFLSVYFFPPLIVGWIVKPIAKLYGKKRVGTISFLCGSAVLILFFFSHNPLFLIVLAFISSFFFSFTFPTLLGAVADYIHESPKAEQEIEGVMDLSANGGWIIGPMLAGIVSLLVGKMGAFGLLGAFGCLTAILLIPHMRKNIHVPNR